MKEYTHISREGLPPKTKEQETLRKKIEQDIDSVPADEYDEFALERRRDEFAASCRDLLSEILDPTDQVRVLEVGAGTGITTRRLNEFEGVDVVALDKKKDYLEYGIQKERIDKSQMVVGDFDNLPFKDDAFDLYTGTAILNQRGDVDAFYREVIRVLKSGGCIFIPWTKTKEESIEKEKSFFKKYGIDVVQEGEWFLFGKNTQ